MGELAAPSNAELGPDQEYSSCIVAAFKVGIEPISCCSCIVAAFKVGIEPI